MRLALPAIVWGHRIKGIENNLDSQFLKDISGGLRRLYAKPRQPKEPFSAVNLKKVVDTSDLENKSKASKVCHHDGLGLCRFFKILRIKES